MKKEDPNFSWIRNSRLKLNELEAPDESEESSLQASHTHHNLTLKPEAPPPGDGERYRLLKLLGAGAMGEVYQAYDSVLHRFVALKLLFPQTLSSPQRVLREARAQARIDHPNVCRVYEVGELEGRPFIAMQYVDGKTFDSVAIEMSLEEKIRVMQRVCEAVHAAHKTGLVHRDIKPANILVCRTDRGWRPYVSDFGLARDPTIPGGTHTGMLLGTPSYMSPEQARGEVHAIDRRSDVYSLGATLYEMISGHKLFVAANSVEALLKVVQEEPRPLRKIASGVSPDLETIVMKCLEKSPARRYRSARALAEDLGRFADGDPILARPPAITYRLIKKAAKHKAIAAIFFVALSAILFSAAIGVHSSWKAAEQAEAAQLFGERVARIESFLRYASALPIHDIRPEIKLVRARIASMQKEMDEFGRFAHGPGHYALARAYHALNENRPALEHLERAWQLEYRNAQVAYTFGEVLGSLYQEELEKLEQITDEEARAQRRKEIESVYKEPALKYLRQAGGAQTESPLYVEAMIGFYEKKYDVALKKTSAAFQETPWLSDAMKLKGDILLIRGSEWVYAGKYEAAMNDFRRAGDAFQAAMNIGRSDLRIYQSECERRIRVINLLFLQSTPRRDVVDQAFTVCDQAMQIDPENGETYNKKSRIHGHWAAHLNNRGEDPVEDLQKCVALSERAIQKNPQLIEAFYNLGTCQRKLGNYAADNGQNPIDWWTKADATFQQAIRARPRFISAYKGRGLTLTQFALYQGRNGRDPLFYFQGAIEAMEAALKINGRDAAAWANLGAICGLRAQFEFTHGVNPLQSIEMSIQSYKEALEINPRLASVHYNAGLGYRRRAAYEWSIGSDPEESLQQSFRYFHEAGNLNPKSSLSFDGLAKAYLTSSLFLLDAGKSPDKALADARKNLQLVIIKKKPDVEDYQLEAEIELAAARWSVHENRYPRELQKAIKILQSCLKLNPANSATHQLFAEAYRWKAVWQQKNSQPVLQTIDLGLNAAGKALEINPRNAAAYAIQSALYLMKAEQENSMDLLILAQESLEKTLQGNRFLQRELEPLHKQISSGLSETKS